MEDYKPNSHKYKEKQKSSSDDKKRVEKVIKGTAKTRKKNEIRKFADVFISEDISSVKSYILMDVLIPSAKKAISDIITNGIDMILYGSSGRPKRTTAGSKVSYRDYYDRRDHDRGYSNDSRARSGYSYDEIVLDSRGEAEEVISQMDALIDMYGIVSVADLYDLVGITGDYTDNKYGWTNIRNAKAVRVRDGYILQLPKPLPID